MIPICKSAHHVLHERPKLLGDDGELLEGSADVILLVLPLHGGVAHPVQRLRHLHLKVGMVWKSFHVIHVGKNDDPMTKMMTVKEGHVVYEEQMWHICFQAKAKGRVVGKLVKNVKNAAQLIDNDDEEAVGACHTSVSSLRDKLWEFFER